MNEATERRLVTVLFADLAGSTQLSTHIDPERVREVQTAFYEMATEELSSLRGRVEKFVGDAVMATFGLPTAHEDDALRAVRAGLRIREGITRLGKALGLPEPLEVRVGVNSGAVAAGPGPGGQTLVSGAPVNLAARLQQAADPGEVLVGETTWLLARDEVDFGSPRIVEAKGFDEPVTTRPVVGISTRSSRRTIPLVGRRRELDLLRETFRRAAETSRAHLVTLVGEAGIGKTRLADELIAGLPEQASALIGRASEFEEDPTFAPVADMVRQELGIGRDAPASELRRLLHDCAEGYCEPDDVERVAAQLGQAIGLASPGEERRYRSAELRTGFLRLLEGKARSGPVLLVFEDLHQARPEMLELAQEIAKAGRHLPLLVLCLARDSLFERQPGWGGGIADSTILRLESLSVQEATDLARAAGESLDDATAESVADHAGGNPFFIVETTGFLLSEATHHPTRPPLPPTVQATVASRLDHLPAQARELVRRASIFPDATIAEGKLAHVADVEGSVLTLLEDSEVLVRDSARPDRWRFRHEFLREVAYESLAKRERLRLHQQVADGIVASGAEERHPNAVAYHLEQAARDSLDLEPSDRTLPARAVEALARAGDRARLRFESASAVDLYRRALSLGLPGDEGGEAAILAGLGEALYWLGEFAEAERTLARALEQARDDRTRSHAGRFLADVVLNVRGDPDRAEALFDSALEAARAHGNPKTVARTLLMAGWVPIWRGERPRARAMFEEALSRARESSDTWAEARALTSLASAISSDGDEAECLELSREALSLGERSGDAFTVAVAHQYIGNSLRRMWRLGESMEHVDEAARIFEDLGARWELASALGDRAVLHRLQGRLDDAERDIRRSLDSLVALGERALTTWTACELARVLIARGDTEAAAQALARGPQTVSDEDERLQVRSIEVLLALARGDTDLARELGAGILERASEAGGPNTVALWITWLAGLLGPEAAGGEESAERARARLEASGWIQHLREPELASEALARR